MQNQHPAGTKQHVLADNERGTQNNMSALMIDIIVFLGCSPACGLCLAFCTRAAPASRNLEIDALVSACGLKGGHVSSALTSVCFREQ